MISYIKGTLADKYTNYAVVDCNGVGFKIYTSFNSLSDTRCIQGNEVVFHTYMYIKEGIMDLYGFITHEELELFEILISVNGVGAKGALALLSAMNPAKLSFAIASGDVATIKSAPGIGAKIAQRIALELKDKVHSAVSDDNGREIFADVVPVASGERDEAVNALIALGYSGAEAKKAVSGVKQDVTYVEDIIKQALKQLM